MEGRIYKKKKNTKLNADFFVSNPQTGEEKIILQQEGKQAAAKDILNFRCDTIIGKNEKCPGYCIVTWPKKQSGIAEFKELKTPHNDTCLLSAYNYLKADLKTGDFDIDSGDVVEKEQASENALENDKINNDVLVNEMDSLTIDRSLGDHLPSSSTDSSSIYWSANETILDRKQYDSQLQKIQSRLTHPGCLSIAEAQILVGEMKELEFGLKKFGITDLMEEFYSIVSSFVAEVDAYIENSKTVPRLKEAAETLKEMGKAGPVIIARTYNDSKRLYDRINANNQLILYIQHTFKVQLKEIYEELRGTKMEWEKFNEERKARPPNSTSSFNAAEESCKNTEALGEQNCSSNRKNCLDDDKALDVASERLQTTTKITTELKTSPPSINPHEEPLPTKLTMALTVSLQPKWFNHSPRRQPFSTSTTSTALAATGIQSSLLRTHQPSPPQHLYGYGVTPPFDVHGAATGLSNAIRMNKWTEQQYPRSQLIPPYPTTDEFHQHMMNQRAAFGHTPNLQQYNVYMPQIHAQHLSLQNHHDAPTLGPSREIGTHRTNSSAPQPQPQTPQRLRSDSTAAPNTDAMDSSTESPLVKALRETVTEGAKIKAIGKEKKRNEKLKERYGL